MPCRPSRDSPCCAGSSPASARPSACRYGAPCADLATTTGSARRARTTERCHAGTLRGAAPATDRRRRRAARWDLSAPARPAETGHPDRSTLALHLLLAIVLELLHARRRADRLLRGAPVLELQAERILLEELVEHLAAQRADGLNFIFCRIPLQENRGERLGSG